MSGKQKEGDNKRRRVLARRAREQGLRPSQAGVTLGGAKQFEHLERSYREGPAPAGGQHKWDAETGGPPFESRRATPSRPSWDPTRIGEPRFEPVGIAYRDLVDEVAHRLRLEFDVARAATEATVTALARSLPAADRQRLLEAVPTELHDEYRVDEPLPGLGLVAFIDAVAEMAQVPREQARYQAQAVLGALAGRAGDLIGSLNLPPELRELTGPLPEGGVVSPPTTRVVPLTDDEIRAALARLPYWSWDRNRLSRTLTLPPANLERVLERLDRIKRDTGRGPHIALQDGTAVLAVRTTSVDAVTQFDVDLAHQVEAAIDEAGAGIDTGT